MTQSHEALPSSGSQTLARGLDALELLAEKPLSIGELAELLDVHRSNAYRILRTLEQRRFVTRDQAGTIRLSPKLTLLARGVTPALHAAAVPVVTELANTLGMTCFLTVLDADEVVTLVSVEPSNVSATIARNPRVRHPVNRGAPGHAMESSLTPEERGIFLGSPEFSFAALEARRMGFAVSQNEVIDGVTSIAVPFRIAGEPPAAIAVVHFNLPHDLEHVTEALHSATKSISQSYE